MIQHRRKDDPKHDDWSDYRNGWAWNLPFNLGSVAGRGGISLLALVLVGFFLAAGSLIFVNFRAFEAVAADHRTMINNGDRLACIVTMTADERTQFRLRGGTLEQWCPWLISPAPR